MNTPEVHIDAGPLRSVLERAGVGIKQVSLDGIVLDANEKFAEMVGRTRAEIIGAALSSFTHPEDLAPEQAMIARLRAGEIGSYTIEKRHRHADGHSFWTRVTSSLVHDPISARPYYVAIVENVDVRVRAQHDLEEREVRLRTIFETAPDSIIVIDESGTILNFSRAAERLFGYDPPEVLGRNASMLMPAPYRDGHDGYIRRYLATGEKRIIGVGRIVVGQRRDGSVFPMELAVGEMPLQDRHLFTGFIRDLTERRETEKRLQDLQTELLHVGRVSAMAQLASALAHEVNQPLTAIGNYLQAARRFMTASGIAPGDRVAEALDKAAAQTERAGQVVRTMRAFVKKGDGARRPEPLNTAIEEACALAMAGLGDLGVRLNFNLAHGLPEVLIDKVPVQQVVVNLVRNAAEAMRDCDRRDLTIRSWLAGDRRVCVEIRDSGPGLAPEVSAQLFQPFVTTKASGMGMGLSICRSIINSHGGSIRAEAVAEGGTRFVFDLPVADEAPP